MSVRLSCEYVLRQTKHHIKDDYIWIDAICINQSNNDEKSEQVAKMGAVFKKAIQVFACVGEHNEDSEFLYDIVQRYEHYIRPWRVSIVRRGFFSWASFLYYPLLLFWKAMIGKARAVRLRSAFAAFLARPYFHRVWVYQELFLAQKVSVNCGHDTIPIDWIWRAFLALPVKLAWWQRRPRLLRDAYYGLRAQEGLLHAGSDSMESMPSEVAMNEVESLHCQDSRNRFYGTLSIIDWAGKEPIQPEYSKDRFDLAVNVLKRLDHHLDLAIILANAARIGNMLELNSKPSRGLLDAANHHISADLEVADTELPRDFSKISDTTGINMCFLTGLRLSCQNGVWQFQQQSKANVITKIDQWENEATTKTQQLASEIILPPEAREGDWLLLCEDNLDGSPYALLARNDNDAFGRWELVGNSFTKKSKAPSRDWKRLVNNLDPVFKLYLDAEDAFCLLYSLQWKWSFYPEETWEESIFTEYFQSRLCRKRFSSFAVREKNES